MATFLNLFGRPTLVGGGETQALPFERRTQVLVFLALRRGWVARDELASMLWPGQATKLAYSNLRKTLFRLQSLPWAGAVEVQGNAIRYQADTDVARFEAALRDGRPGHAIELRVGELLEGFDDDQSEAWTGWLAYERERLRGAWRSAALERAGGEVDAAESIALSARLLEDDPIDEAALRAHMLALARGGQVAGARRAYREFVERLDREFGLAPGAEIKAVHDALGTPGGVTARPAAPVPRTTGDGFVGRSVELQRIATQLARGDCNLLCLVGPGGVGKTRLAQRAMLQLAANYEDGTAFVALEDLVQAGQLGGRLVRELGIGQHGGAQPLDQVIEFLRDRRMLLVLDNFEHLAGGALQLARLLEGCPRLQLIVTSRVRLGLAAEWSLPIEGLAWPDAEDLDRLEAFDAVRLFVNAAQRVEPAFIAAAESASIIDICRQVEGLPLALELAASWTRVLSCDAIAAELRQGTELLRAVDPSRPARHASIEVVFDQSWALLAPVERDALARLSVFRAGFTAEAALAVAEASFPVLGALMDKSLLRKEGTRLFLHPVVNQLAGARLGDGELRTATHAAHAQYFHRMLAELQRPAEAADREALARIDVEFENCRIAWQWCVAHDEPRKLVLSVHTLRNFCDHRGRCEDGLALLREAVAAPPPSADARFGPLVLSAIAHLHYRLDRYPEAIAAATQALDASRATRDPDTRLQCFKVLGACALRLANFADARRYFKRALELAPATTHPRNAAAMLDNLSLVEKRLGRLAEAQRMSLQALDEFRRLGDVAGEALCLNNLGVLHLEQGDLSSALVHHQAALELCERNGLTATRALVVANLTEVTFKLGDVAAAQSYGQRALEAAQQTHNRNIESALGQHLARIALKLGDLPGARAHLQSSAELCIAMGRPGLQLSTLICFAEVLAAQEAVDCAHAVLDYAAAHPAVTVPLRDEIEGARKGWPRPPKPAPWTAPGLGELLHRIAVETPLAHAPLIAAIRSGH